MADSDALRSRRKRRHAAGDHSMCRSGCGSRTGQPLAVVMPPVEGDLDAHAELVALARRLAAAHVADPADAAVARELRATLLALPAPEGAADPLDELRALAADVS